MLEFNSERDESRWIAEEIKKKLDNDEFNEIAIFYRTNNQSRLFEEELRKLSLNYKVVGNVRFYDRKEIKDILSYLNYLINPDDTVSFERVLNVPKRGIGESTLQKLRDYANDNNLSISKSIENLDQISNLSERVKKQITNFTDIINELKSFCFARPFKNNNKDA